MDFRELVQQLGVSLAQTSLVGDTALNPALTGVAAIEQAQAGMVSFIEGSAYAHWLPKTQASMVILPQQPDLWQVATLSGLAWIATDQPRLLFAQALALFYQPWKPAIEIHPTAVIDATVRLGLGVSIGAHVTIQADAMIGDGVCIHPNVVIYPAVELGDRTMLHSNCVIHERTIIGQDCVIHSGAVIGSEGFGFVPTATGWVKMQQSGRVVLEDGVEVGCNTTIDRPSVGETCIGKGTKIDNLVQVGHGCQIGQHCVLVSQVGLAGAVQLGDRVVLAGQVGVSEKVKIGAGAIVTGKAGVIQDVAAGKTVSGFPAIPHKLWLRTSLLLRRLPELLRGNG
jgi:UDP-3-O-[3-hydroxymyristoyl] glucosamine N-acyltransferase